MDNGDGQQHSVAASGAKRLPPFRSGGSRLAFFGYFYENGKISLADGEALPTPLSKEL
jgi:hypothetical protein